MGITPPGKKQLNIYVPEYLDAYVDIVKKTTGLSKSDFIFLLLANARQNFSMTDIARMSDRMLRLGEEGLKEYA